MTRDKNVLLILDEVITGFRVAPGGFQAVCQIEPDLSTFAKVLAGGLPGGCLAGRADVMQVLAFNNPLGKKMKHPGTYNANPLSAAAGCAALSLVATGEPCRKANETAAGRCRQALNELFEQKSVDWVAYGAILGDQDPARIRRPAPRRRRFHPVRQRISRSSTASSMRPCRTRSAVRCCLGGVDWMGWGGSTSSAHTDADVARTVDAFSTAIDLLRSDGLLA